MIAQDQGTAPHETPSVTQAPPLRVGLLIDSLTQPRWVHRVISDIVSSSVATVSVVVRNAEPAVPARPGLDAFLHRVYSRIDPMLFGTGPDPFEKISIEPLLSNVPTLSVKPIKGKFTDELSQDDVNAISEYGLDVALRFGFRILKGPILRLPKYGVWSYHHGDNRRYRGGPPGFWEVMDDEPVTGAVVQILSEELDNGRVIDRTFADTDRISVWRSTSRYYWQASGSVLRKLRDVYESGGDGLGNPCAAPWSVYSHRLYKRPTNREMVRFLGRISRRYLRAKIDHYRYLDQWFLAYKINADETLVDDTLYKFRHLIPPKDRFWADPFPMKRDGRFYIFFEELLYRIGRGHLSVMEVDRRGIVNGPHRILERPYHLSYPFVFSWNGESYMIPETRQAGHVELYRCTSFPDKWEFDRILLPDLGAVDTTLAEIDGRWWMFTSVQVEGARHLYELHLYHAGTPLGPWEAHRANPVKADSYSSRPGGRIVRKNGAYYRPAQEGPGTGMILYKIEHLDPLSYLEIPVGKITPNWAPFLQGTHTFNSADGLTVIDGLLRSRRYF
jgi:hypothetical protein